MTIDYWAIKDKVATKKGIPHVYVSNRKNGKKWKWIVDVDSIYCDNEKDKISKKGINAIFEEAKKIDSEAQTPDSARDYYFREQKWNLEKSRAQGVFRLLFRNKNDAIELADFVSRIIKKEFQEDEQ